ncbi:MAG TPA: hypothetical protein ENG33_01295, partial [Chloroflexi bacterium]|nr:hypothetical protein [Chloroflexota bacterium]
MTFAFAFLLMGFTFTITQAVMVRELMVAFSGNELSIGLVLGCWLLLETLGSGLLGRVISRLRWGTLAYAFLQIILALLLPVALFLAFSIRTLLGVIPGQGVGMGSIFLSSFFILLPLGLIDGAMFTVASDAFAKYTREGIPAVGKVYVLEAVGGIIGGVVFTYLFIPHLTSSQTMLLLAALNLASAISMAYIAQRHQRTAGIIGAAFLLGATLFLLLPAPSQAIHRAMISSRWRGYELAFYGNSVYGNVAAIKQGEQYTFFANGLPIITAPVPDIAFSQELVHLPMLFIGEPHRCLVVSGGVGGVLREVLKYPWERVEYAELDPLLLRAVQQLPTPLTEQELGDPRVHVEYVDGRLLIRKRALQATPPRYNLIILNLPYPSTLQLNRFYTEEFFRLVKAILDDEGVVVITAPGSLTYLSPGMRSLNLSLYETLSTVFPHVRAIPGEGTNLWLASPQMQLEDFTLGEILQHWQEKRPPDVIVTEQHLRVRFDERRTAWFWKSLEELGAVARNRDLHPVGLLYGLTYWNEIFSPGLSGYFCSLARLRFVHLALPLLIIAAGLVAFQLVKKGGDSFVIPLAIATTGFGGMCFDLLIIFAFQVFYGYVYREVGLLITAFMAGLSLGGWLMSCWVEKVRGRPTLLKLEAGLVAMWVLLPLALLGLYTLAGVRGP